ncbi:MAG: tRNA (adenosine(37)-N6)-threonylcarbamoyltransferase complex transferase subunit TsaD [Planctomycetota bacterium]
MPVLGIESTCDETGAAVVDGGRVLSNVVASSAELHAVYGGVVPEIASRACVEAIGPVVREALEQAGVALAEVDAIAVAHRPGLIGSLLVGVSAAQALAWSTGKPLVGVDHVRAHLHSVTLDGASVQLPAVGLVASGGHTSLYHVRTWQDITRLGGTIDDAVGEAYDKVAAILELGYPGGPLIDKLADDGDPNAVKFPRSMLGRDSLDFSFSGLKTAVLYHVRGAKGRERTAADLSKQALADTAASFQAAVIDTLLKKLRRALDRTAATSVILGGGVSANRGLRAALPILGVPVAVPKPAYCTDNAAMIAGLGEIMHAAGDVAGLDLAAVPN